jgi:F-type H+-transporting ATPase subunit c
MPAVTSVVRLVVEQATGLFNSNETGWQPVLLEKTKMRKIGLFLMAAVGMMLAAIPAFAQATNDAAAAATASASGTKAIAAGVGFAIAVFGGALGQSRIGAAACEGAARNPGAAGRIQTMMILGLALIESLVLFALLIVFVKV